MADFNCASAVILAKNHRDLTNWPILGIQEVTIRSSRARWKNGEGMMGYLHLGLRDKRHFGCPGSGSLLGQLCWAMLSYFFSNTQRNFQRHFPSSTISPVFGIQNGMRMLSAPNPLEFIIFRIKTAVFGCAPVYPNGCDSNELSNKKQCFQHVRPPTSRTKFHHSSMAVMTCQLSPCERYHPVRRRWNHFIIYKNHPSTVMLKIPHGFKKYS